jgi:peptidoglycan/xylan/chitin deacetylase (PgdA/CDA1 family)
MQFDLSDEHRAPSRGWRAWLEPPRTVREKAYMSLWKAGRNLSMAERGKLMQDLRQAYAECEIPGGGTRPMTVEEVRLLISDKLISIGAHSVTHPALTELQAEARQFEIVNSKRACEVLSAKQVSAFAYPFGSVDAAVRNDICEAGFVCACSTRYGPVEIDSDPFVLPRVHVVDCDGEAFERSLHYATLTPVSEREAF